MRISLFLLSGAAALCWLCWRPIRCSAQQAPDSARAGMVGLRVGAGIKGAEYTLTSARWWISERSVAALGIELDAPLIQPASDAYRATSVFPSYVSLLAQYEWHFPVASEVVSPYIGVGMMVGEQILDIAIYGASLDRDVIFSNRNRYANYFLVGGAEYFLLPCFSVTGESGFSYAKTSRSIVGGGERSATQSLFIQAAFTFTYYF